jgi:pyruvate dehydrogenase E2 component (dihydrolipoamide acetyltransferase)
MSDRPVLHGIATALRRIGPADAPPVLAVHGLAGDMSVWMLVEPGMRERFATSFLDLPGHGASDPQIPAAGLDGFALHLRATIDHVSPRPAWLIAHSFGAAVATRAASLAPERVAGLVLIAPAGLGAPADPGVLHALTNATDIPTMRAALGRMLARPAMITPAMAEGVLARMKDAERGAALRAVAALLPGLDAALAPHLPALAGLPIHVIRGEADPIIAPDHPLPACWPQAVAHGIANAGHLPQLETPGPALHAIMTALEGRA